MTRRFNVATKSINPVLPALPIWAGLGQIFLLLVDFLYVKRTSLVQVVMADKIDVVDPYLTLFQTTSFRFFQTERVCRRQFQI